MFIGIIPLVVGAVSAAAQIAGSLGAASSSKKQAEQMSRMLEAQMESETEVFALQQDTRLWQQNEQRWQRTREKINLGLARRQAVFDSRVQTKSNRLGRSQAVQGIKGQAYAIDQQRVMQEQGLDQEREGVGMARQQSAAEGQQAVGEIPGTAAMPTESLQDLANLDRANLAREDIRTQVMQRNQTMQQRMLQDQQHARTLYNTQHQLGSGALQTQLALVRAQTIASNQVLGLQRTGTRLETKGARLALRANALADKALTNNMDAAAKAEHESRMAQLQAQMPVSSGGGLSTIANIIGSVAPFAGQLAGTLGGRTSTPQQAPQLDLSVTRPLYQLGQAAPPPPYPGMNSAPRPMNAGAPPYPGMPAPSAAPPPPYPGMGSTLYSGYVPSNHG